MQNLSGTSRSRSTSDTMKHMSNKQVIYKTVESMKGKPFTAYDIQRLCNRDMTIQKIGCIIKGIPGIEKISRGGGQRVCVWKLSV